MTHTENRPERDDAALVQEVYDITLDAHFAAEISQNLYMSARNPTKIRRHEAAEEFDTALGAYVLQNAYNERALTSKVFPKEVRAPAKNYLAAVTEDKLGEAVRVQRARLAEAKITLLLSGKLIEAVDTSGEGFQTTASRSRRETDSELREVTAPFHRYEAAGGVLWLGYPEEDMTGVKLWKREFDDGGPIVRAANLRIVGTEETAAPVELDEGVEAVLYHTAQDPQSHIGEALRELILARRQDQA